MNFWNEQPIIISDDLNDANIYKPIFKLNATPEGILPKGFSFKTLNLDNHLDDIYQLLRNHYILSSDKKFGLYYDKEFLKWYLKKAPPKWLIGLVYNHKLIGFISSILIECNVNGTDHIVPFINLLCLQEKIRNKYFCPLLLLEMRRIIISDGYNFGLFTNTTSILNSFSSVGTYIIPLNDKKFKLPIILFDDNNHNDFDYNENPLTLIDDVDIDQTCHLLNDFLSKYTLKQKFTIDSFKEWFLPKDNPNIMSWVIHSHPDGIITDFISVYMVKYRIIESKKELKIANLFYYVQNEYSIDDLLMMLIDKLKKIDVDKLIILQIMESEKITINKIKSDVKLNYYFYNFQLPKIDSNMLGLNSI
jgi:hypothetical protein